jgi:hypothetical protein
MYILEYMSICIGQVRLGHFSGFGAVSAQHAGGSNGAPKRADAATWGTLNNYLAEIFVFLSFFYTFVFSRVFVTLAAQ